MTQIDIPSCSDIEKKLQFFDKEIRSLPGIQEPALRCCFTKQIIDSLKRIKYEEIIREKEHAEFYTDATNEHFNPLKAAIWHKNRGNTDESFWLVFLSVHFGKHFKTEWNLARVVYGGLGHKYFWTWEKVSRDTTGFRKWISDNVSKIKSKGKFGNHRKYESLNPDGNFGTADTVASYIDWVGPKNDHKSMINNVVEEIGTDNPQKVFDYLYKSMDMVARFGRMAKFDYLTRIGKLKLAKIEPGSAYLSGATGPVDGAKLLFNPSDVSASTLNDWLQELGDHLGYPFVMQVLEDALCNWQKSPRTYQQFRG